MTEFLNPGDSWKYNDSGDDLGTESMTESFNDNAWKSGEGEFGFGDGDETTVLEYGTNKNAKPLANYFRTTFEAGDSIDDITALNLKGIIDDAAAVYLNGQEVWRFNLPNGDLTYQTKATTYIAGSDEKKWRTATLPTSALKTGTNTIAVEVHQNAPSSSDLSFNLELSPQR